MLATSTIGEQSPHISSTCMLSSHIPERHLDVPESPSAAAPSSPEEVNLPRILKQLRDYELIGEPELRRFGDDVFYVATVSHKTTGSLKSLILARPRNLQQSETMLSRAMRATEHPNIVTIYHVGVRGDVLYVITDWIDHLRCISELQYTDEISVEAMWKFAQTIMEAVAHLREHSVTVPYLNPACCLWANLRAGVRLFLVPSTLRHVDGPKQSINLSHYPWLHDLIEKKFRDAHISPDCADVSDHSAEDSEPGSTSSSPPSAPAAPSPQDRERTVMLRTFVRHVTQTEESEVVTPKAALKLLSVSNKTSYKSSDQRFPTSVPDTMSATSTPCSGSRGDSSVRSCRLSVCAPAFSDSPGGKSCGSGTSSKLRRHMAMSLSDADDASDVSVLENSGEIHHQTSGVSPAGTTPKQPAAKTPSRRRRHTFHGEDMMLNDPQPVSSRPYGLRSRFAMGLKRLTRVRSDQTPPRHKLSFRRRSRARQTICTVDDTHTSGAQKIGTTD